MDHRSELMAVFLAEADEQLQLLEEEIMKLEEVGSTPKGIQSLFRAAHTLKGSSAAMGFDAVKNLTHQMENVLDKLRKEELSVTPAVVSLLFECSDALRYLVEDIEQGRNEGRNTAPLVEKLERLQKGQPEATSPGLGAGAAVKLDLPPELATPWEAAEAEGLSRYCIDVQFSERCEMKAARAFILFHELQDHGRVIGTAPDLETCKVEEDFQRIRYWYASETSLQVLEGIWQSWMSMGYYDEVLVTDPSGKPLRAMCSMPQAVQEQAAVEEGPREPVRRAASSSEESRRVAQTIRVDVERLELLMNLVGELVIDQTRIAQVGTILRDGPSDDAVNDLEQISNHISRVVGELQESVMKTRMLPIEQLFNRFPRMVRDLAQSLGKEVLLTISGKETELDRTVIEEIGDPLIHLIRNAIDHGIESAEARVSAGKPAKGSVHIRAHHQENQVVLTIEDDGAGIHAEKIKQSAIRKGLITAQEAESMSEHELIQLIFLPGFSTAAQVSDVSGRGVGMDIVRSHIERLNGLIDVETRLGQGTKFTIKLPLTLAILRGLLVKLRESTYALPMSSVVEIVRIGRHDIQSIKGQTVVQIRDKILPLVWLHDSFHIERDSRSKANLFLVIVGIAEKRLGLIVDELIGNQEIVVKSIGSYVGKVEGISGATILGDGSVSLILDVAGIFKSVERERTVEAVG